MYFHDKGVADQLLLRSPGDDLTVFGQIGKVERTFINLDHCEIVSSKQGDPGTDGPVVSAGISLSAGDGPAFERIELLLQSTFPLMPQEYLVGNPFVKLIKVSNTSDARLIRAKVQVADANPHPGAGVLPLRLRWYASDEEERDLAPGSSDYVLLVRHAVVGVSGLQKEYPKTDGSAAGILGDITSLELLGWADSLETTATLRIRVIAQKNSIIRPYQVSEVPQP